MNKKRELKMCEDCYDVWIKQNTKEDAIKLAMVNDWCIHHINRDHSDNRPENLKILCRRCHNIEHSMERAEASLDVHSNDTLDCMSESKTGFRLLRGYSMIMDDEPYNGSNL